MKGLDEEPFTTPPKISTCEWENYATPPLGKGDPFTWFPSIFQIVHHTCSLHIVVLVIYWIYHVRDAICI